MRAHFLSYAAVAGLLGAAILALPTPSNGQAGAAPGGADLSALITEITAQQVQLSENQTKIDEKIAQVTEEVRQARLMVARGGGKR